MSTSSHTVTIRPGETFVFPGNATILYASNPAGLEGECIDIPDATYRCGYFYVVIDQDSNSGHSMDEGSVKIYDITVGSTVYNTSEVKIITSGDNPGTLLTSTALNSYLPDPDIFTITDINRDTDPDKRQYVRIFFKVLGPLWDSLIMRLANWESVIYQKPHAEFDCAS